MRLIDADLLTTVMDDVISDKEKTDMDRILARMGKGIVEACPTADAELTRHGRWTKEDSMSNIWEDYYQCSICGGLIKPKHGDKPGEKYGYCHCGAKMEVEK